MRVTYHSGRGFGAKHNDRNFESKAEHIDSEKTKDTITWHYYSKDAPEMTFEEAEKKFYAEHFALALDERNQKYRDTRNYKLIKTIDDYYKSRKTCPEDVILQVGRYDDNISKEQLADIYAEYRQWHYKKYPNVQLLSMALHADEPDAGAHIQERQAWIAHDKNGNLCISQSLALQEMGVERPDPTKPEGRHNNAKMTYTADCRKKLQEIAKSHGFEIEIQPKERSKTGLSLIEYQARQEEEKLRLANNALIMLQNKATSLVKNMGNTYAAKDGINFQRSLQKMCNELKIPTPQPKIKER